MGYKDGIAYLYMKDKQERRRSMDFNQWDEDIREVLHEIIKVRMVDPERARKLCEELICIGKEKEDNELLGFAYYYLADAYFSQNQYHKFVQTLIMGLEYQLKASMVPFLAKSYNMFGISEDNQGNMATAIDYYLTALKYSQDHGLGHEAGIVNVNLGNIYTELGEYKIALRYLKKALDYFESQEEEEVENICAAKILSAMCYLKEGNSQMAAALFYEVEEKQPDLLESNVSYIVMQFFKIEFYQLEGMNEDRDEAIDQLIKIIEETKSILHTYSEVFSLCDTLEEIGNYDALWRVIKRMDTLTAEADIINMRLKVLKYKIQYYELTGKREEFLLTCAEYFKLSEQLREEHKVNTRRAIELRLDLEAIKEKQTIIQAENVRLLEKAQTDPLTGLPNRDKMNEYVEAIFDKAYKEGFSLAVELLDINQFKTYNDTYGHQIGDECLKELANILHNLMKKGFFCARYGGDEFIVIYERMSDEEILQVAEELKRDVAEIKIYDKDKNVIPAITIAQGIRNSVPRPSNKVWDYFYAADVAMYRAKKEGRGTIKLIHRATE